MVPCLFWRPSRFPEETASGSQAAAPQAEPDHGWPGPDGLRQGLALGGLGSSQGGLSPGLGEGAITRAKLKGTWRGPEVWGWVGHGAAVGIRQVVLGDTQERLQALSPGRHQEHHSWMVSTQLLSWPRQKPTIELMVSMTPT